MVNTFVNKKKMVRFVVVKVIGALMIISFVVDCQQEEGDQCSMTYGGTGVCKLPENCPSVYEALMHGEPPDTLCGFDGFDPIICCPDGRNTRKPTTTERTTTTERWTPRPPVTEMSIENRYPGDIAKQKCAEYAKSVFVQEYPPILSGNRAPVNRSLCVITSQKLIVGGKKAGAKEFPHMAAVGFNSRDGIVWNCGGTLVSERFVLTAAHCTHSIEFKSAAWVRVGDLNLMLNSDDARPQDRRVIERIRHPGYKKPSTYHDIALLKMDSPVTFNAYVRPACLPTTRNPDSNETVATGWGRVDWTDEKGSNDLLKVTLPMVSFSRCNASFGGDDDFRLKRGIVDDWQICAGKEGSDTCQGDSGGPLVVFTPTQYCMYDIVGVTSLGRLCGSIIPGVYTRVYNYVPWIESVIWGGQ